MTDAFIREVSEPEHVLVDSTADHSEGMSYLQSLPQRLVTLYLPLSLILFVLLFPFYWMALTAVKPDDQLLDLDKYNPFWTWNPTLKHVYKLLFQTDYPVWLGNTMLSRSAPRRCPSPPACLPPMPSCGCATRARAGLAARSSLLISCRRRFCSSRSRRSSSIPACSTRRSR